MIGYIISFVITKINHKKTKEENQNKAFTLLMKAFTM